MSSGSFVNNQNKPFGKAENCHEGVDSPFKPGDASVTPSKSVPLKDQSVLMNLCSSTGRTERYWIEEVRIMMDDSIM